MDFPAGTEVEARHLKKRTRWRRAVLQEAVTPDSARVKVKYAGETAVHSLPLADLKFPKSATAKPVPGNPPKPPQISNPVVEIIDVDTECPPHAHRNHHRRDADVPNADCNTQQGGTEKGGQTWQDWLHQPVESEKMRKAREQYEARRRFTRPRTEPRSAEEKSDGGKGASLLGGLMRQKRQLDGAIDQEKPLYEKVLRVDDKELGGTKRGHHAFEPRRSVWEGPDNDPYRRDATNGWRRAPYASQPEGECGVQEQRESWDVKRRRMGNTNRDSFLPHNSNPRNSIDGAPVERHPVRVEPEDLAYRIPRRHSLYDSSMPRYSYVPPSWPTPGRRTEEPQRRNPITPAIEFEEAGGSDSADEAPLPVKPTAAKSRKGKKGATASVANREKRKKKKEKAVKPSDPRPKPVEKPRKRPPASRVATKYMPSGSPFLGSIDCDEEDTKILELCAEMLHGGKVSSKEDENGKDSVRKEVTVRGKGRKSKKPTRWCRSFITHGQQNFAKPWRREEEKASAEAGPVALNLSFTSAIRSRCRAFGSKEFSAPVLVECACGESNLNNDSREESVQCRVCGLWSHLGCTQYAEMSGNVLKGKNDSRRRFMCLRCLEKLTMPVSLNANITDSDGEDGSDEMGKNGSHGDDEVLSVQIRSLNSILWQMEKGRVKKVDTNGDEESAENVTRHPLSPDEVEARVENIETLRSGICRPSTGERERRFLDLLTRHKQACS
eukprot:GFKZ01008919.1.p1 GENE.GFKZ01008919.1~~GFKZ01008919.1.p1  ORF type:complete len:723 (+),score=82.23 GFKZ01008919.1:255-2423(+)